MSGPHLVALVPGLIGALPALGLAQPGAGASLPARVAALEGAVSGLQGATASLQAEVAGVRADLQALQAATRGSVCTAITSLPYTISAPGKYCLKGNLHTPITSGNAITITADFVVLDLNGFSITGVSSTETSLANGVYSANRHSVTVRNGTVSGFMRGVEVAGLDAVGATVESMRVVGCTYEGIRVENRGAVVRGNQVVHVTGSPNATQGGNGVSVGIGVFGSGNRIVDNEVTDVIGIASPQGGEGYGMILNACDYCVVEGNRVANTARHEQPSYGIEGGFSTSIIVVGNRIINMNVGITAYTATGIFYTDNVALACDVAYGSGIDGGNNR